jgi:hypothetical protein
LRFTYQFPKKYILSKTDMKKSRNTGRERGRERGFGEGDIYCRRDRYCSGDRWLRGGGKRGGWMRVGWVDEEVKGLRDSEILVAQLVEAFD